ncbi:MAG: hypothetical protein ABJA78_19590 [Ferruginibacter sp.]
MLDLNLAIKLIDGWALDLNIGDVSPSTKFNGILRSVVTIARQAIAEGENDGLNDASILLDALFLVVEHCILTEDVVEARTMLTKIVEVDRSISCEMFGFSIEDFKIVAPSSDRVLLFLRPLNSSNRYQFLNRFNLAERPILRYPQEIPLLSLEASLHRIFQPIYQTVSVGGIYDAFGMSRIFIPGRDREKAWREIVDSLSRLADVIFLVPSDTSGVGWEIGLLKRTNRISKTVFCMVPMERNSDVRQFLAKRDEFEGFPACWVQAKITCERYGIFLPPYDEAGGFLFFRGDGSIANRLPFESLWTAELVDSLNHRPDLQ